MERYACLCRMATDEDIPEIHQMSTAWEQESNCRGYTRNSEEYLHRQTIYLAEINDIIVGYVFGQTKTAGGMSAAISDGSVYYEIEDLYVAPEYRSRGIGKTLVKYLENQLKLQSVNKLFLNTATNDYKKILHFYVEEIGMTFWSATLFKELN